MDDAERVIESVARVSYGRLVSFLAARSGDVASAEDSLSEAFVAALRTWPSQGVPAKPEAWLLHAARRRLIDGQRLDKTRDTHVEALRAVLAEAEEMATGFTFPDERLKLLFVCAHPAIDARVHTPLMLQVVLGLDANAIAEAFLTPAATMGQRLSRAKAKIRDTRIAFAVPTGTELAPRLFSVLEAIYAAYNRGWDDVDGADAQRHGLVQESIWLARLVAELLPEEPEALGLLALMQYCEARRPARRTAEGEYIPISLQDTSAWELLRLEEAESLLARAARFGRMGRFQLEAAVQGAHVERMRTGSTDWWAIALLYEGLVRLAPTVGALLGRAAAVAEAYDPARGLELLDQIPAPLIAEHQPYWAVRAHLESRLGRKQDASAHFEQALRLTRIGPCGAFSRVAPRVSSAPMTCRKSERVKSCRMPSVFARIVLTGVLGAAIACQSNVVEPCVAPPSGQPSAAAAAPAPEIKLRSVDRSGAWPSNACRENAHDLLRAMTLAEKIGQMTQAERLSLRPGDIQHLGLGSILSAGGSAPGNGSAKEWADMLDELHAEARNSRLHIPLVYGSDAVHGHNNVIGATIFPHNIGLGCAHSAELVEAVARATAIELAATGVDWTFAPVVGPGRDERWGRTYETFSEDPKLSAELGVAAIRGYQSARLGSVPTSVLACAKHFAGDGSTLFSAETHKIDQGDTRLSPTEFERLALAPYVPAIAAGVGTVMASFSSVDGVKMHGHRKLLTDVLKGRLGFKGFVISDFSGIHQLDGNFDEQVVSSVNAGIDMFMEPDQFERFIESLTQSVENGKVSMSRIDDAVERILVVKCEAGLFEKPPVDRSLLAQVGSKEHLELARRAVRESAVLLKNEKNILPLSKSARILVAGSGARSMARQAGGWTIGWQGAENKPVLGTTLFDALRAGASDPARVILDESAISNASADVAVLVMSEAPYAEGMGDSADLALPASDLKQLDALRARRLPVVVVLFSGRPLVLGAALDKASAVLAAFLPGSAGEGIADILYGEYAPTGKLSHSWPRRLEDVPINQGASPYDPLFPLGFGLSYAKTDAKK